MKRSTHVSNTDGEYPLRAPEWLIELVRQARLQRRSPVSQTTRSVLLDHHLETVCDGARCPNKNHCFSRGTATFMILGSICTRNCTFCAVGTGMPASVDHQEPERIRESVRQMGLSHAVITSVTRDDLSDGGAGQFAAVVRALRTLVPPVSVEVLLPDLRGSLSALEIVLDAAPDIVGHNIETVARLYPAVRSASDYNRSLRVLSRTARNRKKGNFVKSGFMVGLGEVNAEIYALMKDLREAGVNMLTIGQYLAPSLYHHQVVRYVSLEEFADFEKAGLQLGFDHVMAGPLVRSSYHAAMSFRAVEAHDQTMASH